MRFAPFKRIYYAFLVCALYAQMLGLFFCGDADCLQEAANEECAALLCSLLNQHSAASQGPAGGADKDCSCHMPTISGAIFSFNYHPITQFNNTAVTLQFFSAHNSLVYHPPQLSHLTAGSAS
jgi:hypothetical protein